jgi:hypothetical protein
VEVPGRARLLSLGVEAGRTATSTGSDRGQAARAHRTGVLQPGERLPNEPELARRMGVAQLSTNCITRSSEWWRRDGDVAGSFLENRLAIHQTSPQTGFLSGVSGTVNGTRAPRILNKRFDCGERAHPQAAERNLRTHCLLITARRRSPRNTSTSL